MDDICDFVDIVYGVRKLTIDIDKVLKIGGFKVKGWIFNEMFEEKESSDIEKEMNVF